MLNIRTAHPPFFVIRMFPLFFCFLQHSHSNGQPFKHCNLIFIHHRPFGWSPHRQLTFSTRPLPLGLPWVPTPTYLSVEMPICSHLVVQLWTLRLPPKSLGIYTEGITTPQRFSSSISKMTISRDLTNVRGLMIPHGLGTPPFIFRARAIRMEWQKWLPIWLG